MRRRMYLALAGGAVGAGYVGSRWSIENGELRELSADECESAFGAGAVCYRSVPPDPTGTAYLEPPFDRTSSLPINYDVTVVNESPHELGIDTDVELHRLGVLGWHKVFPERLETAAVARVPPGETETLSAPGAEDVTLERGPYAWVARGRYDPPGTGRSWNGVARFIADP